MNRLLRLRGWPRFHRLMAYLGGFGVALSIVSPALGRIEGRMFPVAASFRLARVVEDGNFSLIYGSLAVLRPACVFVGIDWRLIQNGRQAVVSIEYQAGTRARPAGLSEFGPWRLSVPPDDLTLTRADVIHACPWHPWQVVTPLYP